MTKYRTHTCNELNIKNEGEKVLLSGWVNKKRDHGNLLFIDLRDNYGITQCVIDKKKSRLLKTYQLSNHNLNSKKTHKLECHLEYDLFESLLKGRFPWNTSLTGSTIMYKRNPNIFNVDMQFSLNFLRV